MDWNDTWDEDDVCIICDDVLDPWNDGSICVNCKDFMEDLEAQEDNNDKEGS